jgi:tetratricopeptide (TPR) repeat protein
MWRVLGKMHAARSRFDRAKELLQRAYDKQRAIAGPNDSTAAFIYHELAMVVGESEGPAAARPMLDSSAARLRKSLGSRHSDVAVGLEDRAVMESDTARRRAILDSAREIRRFMPIVDSMALAADRNRRGNDAWSRGQWAAAYAYFDSSLRILDRKLPPDHANRLHVLNNVGAALSQLGEWKSADSLQRLLLEAQRRSLGAQSTEYATTLESMALTHASMGRLADTEAELRISLVTNRQVLAADHWRIENTLRNLGLIVVARGRFGEGISMLDSAIAMRRIRDGDTSAALGYLLGQRSHAFLSAGRVEEGRRDALAAERLIRGKFPDGDGRRPDLDLWLGLADFAHGDTADAVAHFTAALAGYTRTRPQNHPTIAMANCALGVALAGAGKTDVAEPQLREACPRYARYGLSSPVILKWGRDALARLKP